MGRGLGTGPYFGAMAAATVVSLHSFSALRSAHRSATLAWFVLVGPWRTILILENKMAVLLLFLSGISARCTLTEYPR